MVDPISGMVRYLSADVQALDTLGQNVANLTTPGFRALQHVANFGDSLMSSDKVDTRDGALLHTGRSLDVALQGPGFFQVSANGETFLTRDGQFKLTSDGQLVDAMGRAVMGSGGPISLDTDAVTIGEDGAIRNGEDVLDNLVLVDVADASQLRSMGGNVYAASGDLSAAEPHVHQGALEGSNVDPGHEMVRLMEVMRHASSVQHAISTYHSALSSGIDQLGKDS
ncbi:flagellar hook basal-body protein [Pinirhizobacter sp.]|jgi:flagellar basal body rod protein FlgG|uniref:flagellar hook-basal body protein n=1 Tax=Pinirhizobacter sp. TaxID=2950432 RepID=UPI002F3E5B3D